MEKDDIQKRLAETGRAIIKEKGAEALTVRKLSEASGCSVGTIYNQFSNMDNFTVLQNYMTLDELDNRLSQVVLTANPYADMNRLSDVFADYVLNNRNLWYMLYDFHLRRSGRKYSFFYLRKAVRVLSYVSSLTKRILPRMEAPERILSFRTLWLDLFALSSLLTTPGEDLKTDKKLLCRLVLNTFVAGLSVLEDKRCGR